MIGVDGERNNSQRRQNLAYRTIFGRCLFYSLAQLSFQEVVRPMTRLDILILAF